MKTTRSPSPKLFANLSPVRPPVGFFKIQTEALPQFDSGKAAALAEAITDAIAQLATLPRSS
jgi:hypothetical protein